MKESTLSVGRLSALFAAVAALSIALIMLLPSAAHAADYAAAGSDAIGAASADKALTIGAAATTKTVKHADFTTKLSVAKKKATVVKKGTTKLKVKPNGGYVMFKAPKTKTYKLTLSNLTSKNPIYSAFAEVLKPQDKSILMTDVKTQGGRSNVLWLADKANVAKDKKDPISSRLASRYAKIKLKKGERVFLYIYGTKTIGTFKATLKIA